MARLNLKLRIGIPLGTGNNGEMEFNWLPDESSEGYPVADFQTISGKIFSNNENVLNELEVSDLLRQAASQGILAVHISDGNFMSKLAALYKSKQTFLVGLKTELISSDYALKTAKLLMPYACINQLTSSLAAFYFPSKFARIDFSFLDLSQSMRQAEKIMSDGGSAISNAVGSTGC